MSCRFDQILPNSRTSRQFDLAPELRFSTSQSQPARPVSTSSDQGQKRDIKNSAASFRDSLHLGESVAQPHFRFMAICKADAVRHTLGPTYRRTDWSLNARGRAVSSRFGETRTFSHLRAMLHSPLCTKQQ